MGDTHREHCNRSACRARRATRQHLQRRRQGRRGRCPRGRRPGSSPSNAWLHSERVSRCQLQSCSSSESGRWDVNAIAFRHRPEQIMSGGADCRCEPMSLRDGNKPGLVHNSVKCHHTAHTTPLPPANNKARTRNKQIFQPHSLSAPRSWSFFCCPPPKAQAQGIVLLLPSDGARLPLWSALALFRFYRRPESHGAPASPVVSTSRKAPRLICSLGVFHSITYVRQLNPNCILSCAVSQTLPVVGLVNKTGGKAVVSPPGHRCPCTIHTPRLLRPQMKASLLSWPRTSLNPVNLRSCLA